MHSRLVYAETGVYTSLSLSPLTPLCALTQGLLAVSCDDDDDDDEFRAEGKGTCLSRVSPRLFKTKTAATVVVDIGYTERKAKIRISGERNESEE